MNYDISSDRYKHLAGLTDREIESVMLFCDMAEHVAGKDLKKNDQQENGIFRGGVTGRDSDALLHRDTKTAKPARATWQIEIDRRGNGGKTQGTRRRTKN